jgi:hypothetical protein
VEIRNPLDYPDWNSLLLSSRDSSFFHSSNWARVLHESYAFKPIYLTAVEDKKLSLLIPLMEVKSVLTGKRGVSLPFTDYCDILFPSGAHFGEAMNRLIEYGKRSGWGFIEMRSGVDPLGENTRSSFYYGHVLDLSQGEERIFANLRDSTKRNIKKAIKEGVTTRLCTSLESVREFYRLHCLTRREHGLPPQPFIFFKKIFEHIILQGLGFVVLASHNAKNIAGAVYFHFGQKAIFKYGASSKEHQHMRANNLLMWEAIRWFSGNGFKDFCFGRTDAENAGLRQFKSGWGGEERTINYYRYNLKTDTFAHNNSQNEEFHKSIIRKMPVPLLRMAGSLLYRHMG